jgi:predicted nuclease of predicted toxin-antitoxin system
MRLLIDECIDERLRLLFPGYDCQTARFANLAGLKNGRLLNAAEAAGFDVLITVDQHIPDQQNLTGRKISLVILCAPTNRRCDLVAIVPNALVALSSIERGAVVRVR